MTDLESDIKPQPGPQTRFLKSHSDVLMFGGSAGSSKTYSLLLEPLRHVHNPDFGCVIFRRTFGEIDSEGGLWDESEKIYPYVGATPLKHASQWVFPNGASISFSHMQHDKDKLKFLGSQICLIEFDEVVTFGESQFWYMFSRNRSTSGIRPSIRCSCNPDADSWVARLLAWWIDQDTGLPIPERSGVIRWFIRDHDVLVWGDSREELIAEYPNQRPTSFSFIPAKLADNPALMRVDPDYLGKLMAMPTVDRERLLGGNWKIRAAAGLVFSLASLQNALVDATPFHSDCRVRFWDKASTNKSTSDFTVGLLLSKTGNVYWVEDVVRGRWVPSERDQIIRAVAAADKAKYPSSPPIQIAEEEGGSSGKDSAYSFVTMLQGHTCRTVRPRGNKEHRAGPVSSQMGAGNVKILRAGWTDAFIAELAAFPEGKNDDQTDALASGYGEMVTGSPTWIPVPRVNVPSNSLGRMAAAKRLGLYGIR